jgi:hypothetical protein
MACKYYIELVIEKKRALRWGSKSIQIALKKEKRKKSFKTVCARHFLLNF